MWTDSTIALAWIKTEPHKLKTFVSNRVAEIQTLSKDYHWKHVSSKNNPADLISRAAMWMNFLKNEM
ncbi:speckle-type POZ protein-like B [Trichonephila clavipes]|nr:speckle-type POZ protein-like B [Trichonephila clavipes]